MASGDIVIDVPKYGQSNRRCCWYACYKMLYGWKGKSVSQVRLKLSNVGITNTSALLQSQWGIASSALGLWGMRVGHLKHVENMRWCLKKCGPIWTAGNFATDGGGHAIVISGIRSDGVLRISDPWEFYFRDSYNYMTHSQWSQKVRDAPFACQLFW